MPKITWARLIWEGSAPPGYTAGITSPHKFFSSTTHQESGDKSTIQYFGYTSPSSLAGASIKLDIHWQDRYELNSVLKDISRKKGVAGPCGIGRGSNSYARLERGGISSWIGIPWVGTQPESPNNSPSAHKTTAESWLFTSCLEYSVKLIKNTMGKKKSHLPSP